MKAKTFEIRDRATFIPVLAVKLSPENEADRFLLARAGYGTKPSDQAKYVLLTRLDGGDSTYDPFKWHERRTMRRAHQAIIELFDEVESGEVFDVEYLEGEVKEPKKSERFGG